jgi:hypothetical protein
MNRDLFLAILAMDSYNRGYGAGVNGLAETGSIGNATIRAFGEDEQKGWEAAGFYAIGYTLNGERIISYRGTNFETTGGLASELAKDAWNGWTLGAGYTGASQAQLALDFYTAVTGGSVYNRTVPGGRPVLVGHSLGGGLAAANDDCAESIAA